MSPALRPWHSRDRGHHSELTRLKGKLMPKRRYSGFYDARLDARLKELKPDKVIVAGVCTGICVMCTVADARNRDHVVEVPRDCVASFDPEAHAFALRHMEKILGARIVWSGLAWSEDKPGAYYAVSVNRGAEVTKARLRHLCCWW